MGWNRWLAILDWTTLLWWASQNAYEIWKFLYKMSEVFSIFLQELKIGLSQSSVLSVFHPDAEEFYNVNNNLEKVNMAAFIEMLQEKIA